MRTRQGPQEVDLTERAKHRHRLQVDLHLPVGSVLVHVARAKKAATVEFQVEKKLRADLWVNLWVNLTGKQICARGGPDTT